jgi:hypothetical protein
LRLTNSTVLPARCVVGAGIEGGRYILGMLVAKATFRFDSGGGVELEKQEPLPLLDEDQQTPLGVLPADVVARRGQRFEVMLLGHAYGAGRRSVPKVKVALSVGHERREMLVFGDRHWQDRETISPPVWFERLPLVYERCFGGSKLARLDAATELDVFDPVNRRGRGFDTEEQLRGLTELLGAPPGFPVLVEPQRWLPNLENPAALIEHWTDAPEPVGWAPAYRDTAISLLRVIRREGERARRAALQTQAAGEPVPEPEDTDEALYRAHSDWVIDLPSARATLRLENLLPDAPVLELALPELRVVADYELYQRRGERDLRPHAIVLLPDEHKFYIVYRLPFQFEPGPAHERAFRLRTEPGWFTSAQGERHA